MQDGAVGITTALIYPPGSFASTEELIELVKVAGEYGGTYFTHLRNESFAIMGAIREALTIGKEACVPVHIYHLKVAGEQNWPLMDRAIALIDSARTAGMDVTADIYPYIRNGIGLGSFVHPRHYDKGDKVFRNRLSDKEFRLDLRREIETTSDWENWYRWVGMDWGKVLLLNVPKEMPQEIVGMSLAEASSHLGKDSWTTFFDLVQTGWTDVSPASMNEGQKFAALHRPWVMIDTDADPVNPDSIDFVHPRAFGAFPRVIAKYVREDGVIELEEAVRRMTSLAANRLGLYDRGRIAPGMLADIVIFDPAQLGDLATFQKPLQYSEGIDFMWVNGILTIDNRELTGAKGGRPLRHRHKTTK
jgi:N-acyl-D-aspartate/D-glutamate deacylase